MLWHVYIMLLLSYTTSSNATGFTKQLNSATYLINKSRYNLVFASTN